MKDVDGVPTLVAKTTGPMRAGLVFRVGRADETLATGGITHLVEHLALHRHGVADYHYNGTTGVTTTSFLTQGTPEAVIAFLHGVCASLRDLPTARLATEKKILETEASGRGRSMTDQLALWRHGARDFGLTGYPEFGIHTLTTEQVTNAVTIAAVAHDLGLPERAVVIALATAQQESRLRNLDYGDRDSLGLFQQRPSQGWGTEAQVQDPAYAAGKFFDHLVQVPGWETGRLTDVAQAVQRSGFPEAYQQWEPMATELAAVLVAKPTGSGAIDCT